MAARTALLRMVARAVGRARRRHGHGEQGAAILETALSTIILLTFIFGIMEACTAVYSYHFISEAAREAVRYAIVRGATCSTATDFTSACPASTTDIQAFVQNLNYPGINPAYMTVTPSWVAYAKGSSCPASGPCNSPGNQVKVTIQYNFPLSIPFIPSSTIAMSSSAAMIIAR